MFLACRCVCGEGRAAPGISDIKSIAGRSPLAVHTPSWGVVFPCPQAERSVLFSFPHHLLSQIPPSVSRPGVEFQPSVENKRERNPNPTCGSVGRDKDPAYAWSPLTVAPSLCCRVLQGHPWVPVGTEGCLSQAGAEGGWGNKGLFTQWDPLSLYGRRRSLP